MAGIEITIEKDVENALLERREVKFTATSAGATPKEADVKAALAAKLNVPAENILIEHVYQEMGSHQSKCIAKAYKKPVVKKEKKKADAEKKE